MSAEAARRWSQQSSRKRRGETSDAEAAFKKIRYSAENRLPVAATRRMIVAHFQADDDIGVPAYRVSLMCPLSKARMSVAARGINCAHIQCFDLEKYLRAQVQCSLWACPIAGCSKETRQAQLRVDEYFCDALKALRNRPEVTDLDLLPNGDYTAVEPHPSAPCEAVADDGSPYIPEPVESKREPLGSSNASATSDRDRTVVTVSSSPEAVVADVVVIDDEELMKVPTTSRRRQSKSGKWRAPRVKESDELLDSLAKKLDELKRRETELKAANEKIERLREALAHKERFERILLQLSATDADEGVENENIEVELFLRILHPKLLKMDESVLKSVEAKFRDVLEGLKK